ncbi:MAG: Hsp20/alpha crystallin family protein [Planctomycetota bacterium]|jgi:HSP20 family protein
MEHRDTWQEMRKHLSDMAAQIDNALRKVPPFSAFRRAGCPPVNLYETDTEFIVQAEVPGVAQEALQVTVKDGALVIEGREDRREYESCACLCEERREAEFRREIDLPDGVDLEAEPGATVSNGLLTVRLKRGRPKEGKTIRVEVT